MRHLLCLPFLYLPLVTGCAYLDAQSQLVEQARKGVALAASEQGEHAALIEQLQTLRRDKINNGFDEDVREHTNLTPQWVIEHRRAYEAGLDALVTWHSAATAADRAASQNLKAIDAALERLGWLQSIEMGWMGNK
jgi:hypothetical protein